MHHWIAVRSENGKNEICHFATDESLKKDLRVYLGENMNVVQNLLENDKFLDLWVRNSRDDSTQHTDDAVERSEFVPRWLDVYQLIELAISVEHVCGWGWKYVIRVDGSSTQYEIDQHGYMRLTTYDSD